MSILLKYDFHLNDNKHSKNAGRKEQYICQIISKFFLQKSMVTRLL